MMLPTSALNDTVVCLAPGPSLTADDVDACRGLATIIAVNDAVELAPWADVCYSSDTSRWWPKRKWMTGFAGLRVRVSPDPWRRQDSRTYPYTDTHGVIVLRQTGDEGLELARDGLRTLKNSGGSAINLAVHLGARRIVLVGYDMAPGHFNTREPDGSPYPLFRQRLGTMAAPLRAAGVSVINCSRRSALTCFDRGVLREVLGPIEAVA